MGKVKDESRSPLDLTRRKPPISIGTFFIAIAIFTAAAAILAFTVPVVVN